MMRWYWIVAVVLVLAAWAVTAVLYPGLPDKIPSHWDIHGKVDHYGSKATLFLLPATMIFMMGLFAFLPALSPRNYEVDSFRSTYLFVMVLIVGLFGYMQGVILYAAWTGHVDVARAIVGGLYLFFALSGNVLGKVRRNFYIGVRVPWTLANDRVWNDTHRVAAWLFVIAGLTGFAIVVAGGSLLVSLIPMGVAVVVPIVYAFVHYKRLERRGSL
jgi:uncharacterized membrane protein